MHIPSRAQPSLRAARGRRDCYNNLDVTSRMPVDEATWEPSPVVVKRWRRTFKNLAAFVQDIMTTWLTAITLLMPKRAVTGMAARLMPMELKRLMRATLYRPMPGDPAVVVTNILGDSTMTCDPKTCKHPVGLRNYGVRANLRFRICDMCGARWQLQVPVPPSGRETWLPRSPRDLSEKGSGTKSKSSGRSRPPSGSQGSSSSAGTSAPATPLTPQPSPPRSSRPGRSAAPPDTDPDTMLEFLAWKASRASQGPMITAGDYEDNDFHMMNSYQDEVDVEKVSVHNRDSDSDEF